MPYSMELPDGSLMQDIPDDVNPKDALSDWVDKIHAPQQVPQVDPTRDMSGGQKFMAGVGKGVTDVGQNLARMLTPKGMEGGIVEKGDLGISDEQMAQREARDAPLMETGAGMAGELVGEMAATALPGGAAIKGMQGTSKVLQAASKLPNASSLAAKVLRGGAGVVGSTPTLLAAQGAAQGALAADDPEEGAVTGALLGGGLGVAGKLGKKAIDSLGKGLIKKSDAASKVEDLIGEKLPVSMAAESETTRQIFGDVLTYFPGRNIHKQVKDAKKLIKSYEPGDVQEAVDVVLEGAKGEKRNIFQKLAANSITKTGLSGLAGTALGALPVAASISAVTIPLTMKSGQKVLLGSTELQKAVRTLIAKEAIQEGLKQGGRKAGVAATSAGAVELTDDDYGSY